MLETPFGMEMDASFPHPEKAPVPIVLTVAGIVNDINDVQFSNA